VQARSSVESSAVSVAKPWLTACWATIEMNAKLDFSTARFLKPSKVLIRDGTCIFRSTFRRWTFAKGQISHIEVARTLSLVDEIALTLRADGRQFFIPETIDGFHELTDWLDIAGLFGSDWYSRAESGEHLVMGE
jgi:hypothetical protein